MSLPITALYNCSFPLKKERNLLTFACIAMCLFLHQGIHTLPLHCYNEYKQALLESVPPNKYSTVQSVFSEIWFESNAAYPSFTSNFAKSSILGQMALKRRLFTVLQDRYFPPLFFVLSISSAKDRPAACSY